MGRMKDLDTKMQESLRLTLALGRWKKRAAASLKKLRFTTEEFKYIMKYGYNR